MFIIEIFTTDETHISPTWLLASRHTQSNDRDDQYQRFLNLGIAAENLRFKESN